MFLLFIHISCGGKLRRFNSVIVCSGGFKVNPGRKIKRPLSLCHWNLNNSAAQNFNKVSLLQALSVTHDYDTICFQ